MFRSIQRSKEAQQSSDCFQATPILGGSGLKADTARSRVNGFLPVSASVSAPVSASVSAAVSASQKTACVAGVAAVMGGRTGPAPAG